jgi:HSP20 family protein
MLIRPASPIWSPRADVYRTKSGWIIKLDLAGVATQDVEVRLAGRELRVAGVRRDRSVPQGCIPYAIEISYSRFERVFELPQGLEEVSVSIEQNAGIVMIRLEEARRD